MTESYRDKPLLCPSCSTPMTSRQSELAVVDVCPDCNGLWVDWFDGEIATVAGSLDELPPAHVASRATGTCPLCATALVLLPYGDGAVEIFRCGECAGAFVPRRSFDHLVLEGPPSDPDEDEPSMIARFVAWLRAELGGRG